MSSIFSSIVAMLIAIPFIVYLIVFIIGKQIMKHHKRSVHLAIDISTIFFIFSVHYLIITIWNISLLWAVLLFMLLIAMTFVVVHWKIKEEINYKKVFKGFWRFNFLIFLSMYIILLLYGLFQSISNSIL